MRLSVMAMVRVVLVRLVVVVVVAVVVFLVVSVVCVEMAARIVRCMGGGEGVDVRHWCAMVCHCRFSKEREFLGTLNDACRG
jgi:hypothetical protein